MYLSSCLWASARWATRVAAEVNSLTSAYGAFSAPLKALPLPSAFGSSATVFGDGEVFPCGVQAHLLLEIFKEFGICVVGKC